MKYLTALCGALGATMLLTQTVVAKPIREYPSYGIDYISSAFAKTRSEQYQEAIAILKTGEQYYRKQGDERRAYASKLLVLHIQQDLAYRKRQQSGEPQPDNATAGTLLGSCMGQDCSYGVELFAPANTSPKYGGIMVLQKRLRYFKDARNLPQPMWGMVDVKVMPARKQGEYINQCQDKVNPNGDSGRMILAITSGTKKNSNSTETVPAKYAWSIDSRSGLIKEIPGSSVVCVVEAP
jgi:hypothetical protein